MEAPQRMTDTGTRATSSSWMGFAGLMILLLGVFNAIEGLVALANDKYRAFIGGSFYVFNLTGWAIIHLILGLVMIGIGIGILGDKSWARAAGIALAGAALVLQMLYLTSAPLWSLVNIGFCALVIYALVVPRRAVT